MEPDMQIGMHYQKRRRGHWEEELSLFLIFSNINQIIKKCMAAEELIMIPHFRDGIPSKFNQIDGFLLPGCFFSSFSLLYFITL